MADNFTGKIVGVVVAVVVVGAIALPIITGLTAGDDPVIDPDSTVGTIVNILPVFLVLAILMIIVRMFLNGKN